jgi:hypothetical protein
MLASRAQRLKHKRSVTAALGQCAQLAHLGVR